MLVVKYYWMIGNGGGKIVLLLNLTLYLTYAAKQVSDSTRVLLCRKCHELFTIFCPELFKIFE